MTSPRLSLEEEIQEIQTAMERILFDEIIKGILGHEVKKCASMHYEDAYHHVFLHAFPRVADSVEKHVSFKHIFDTNCRRHGLYGLPTFNEQLTGLLDERVQRGYEVIPGGTMGSDFDMQLRFSLVRYCGGDSREGREKFLRGPVKAPVAAQVTTDSKAEVDLESQSDKDIDESDVENVKVVKKNLNCTSPRMASSKESSSMRPRK